LIIWLDPLADESELRPSYGRAVKTTKYHHGDLPRALLEATADLITEQGLGGFSLREVARRAGVSHAAPAHHFRDTTALLTALAVEAFQLLNERMELTRSIEDPVERLVQVGIVYVVTGRDYPAHLAIIARRDLLDPNDPAYIEWGSRSYFFVEDRVRELAQQHNPSLDVDDATRLLCSAMQGLILLHPQLDHIAERRGKPPVDLVAQARAFMLLLVSGFLAPPPADGLERGLGDPLLSAPLPSS